MLGTEELEIRVGLLELTEQMTLEFSNQAIAQFIDILKRMEEINKRLKELERRK